MLTPLFQALPPVRASSSTAPSSRRTRHWRLLAPSFASQWHRAAREVW